ncbi:hypothetical protein ACHBTE_25300 [Streptomyces sp. M41]|uniref:hypothetical protein n=1 Tax=Streptomyces sp. M41 TaxID=3059412 RepID=UPI00374D0D4C
MIRFDRAGRLREELVEIDAEVARLKAAGVVIGQFVAAEHSGQADDPAMAEELEQITTGPGTSRVLLVPHHGPGMVESALPADYQAIMKIVAVVPEPDLAKAAHHRNGRPSQLSDRTGHLGQQDRRPRLVPARPGDSLEIRHHNVLGAPILYIFSALSRYEPVGQPTFSMVDSLSAPLASGTSESTC